MYGTSAFYDIFNYSRVFIHNGLKWRNNEPSVDVLSCKLTRWWININIFCRKSIFCRKLCVYTPRITFLTTNVSVWLILNIYYVSFLLGLSIYKDIHQSRLCSAGPEAKTLKDLLLPMAWKLAAYQNFESGITAYTYLHNIAEILLNIT